MTVAHIVIAGLWMAAIVKLTASTTRWFMTTWIIAALIGALGAHWMPQAGGVGFNRATAYIAICCLCLELRLRWRTWSGTGYGDAP